MASNDHGAGTGRECAHCPWREDFPIEWEADHYISRRELARFLVAGSGLLAAAGAGLAVLGAREGGRITAEQRIARVEEVPPGGSLLFRYPTDQDPCILVRRRDDELRAYSQVCTHLACAVIHRPGSSTLYCPCHHGLFDLEDGRPAAGPPTRPLPRVLLEVRGDEIYAVGLEG